ncbi:hypothetical protein FVEN_g12742 [Fusarium venenatum]|nr:hypothetical protein FVEN_g12742 [Fusarium venenatum]
MTVDEVDELLYPNVKAAVQEEIQGYQRKRGSMDTMDDLGFATNVIMDAFNPDGYTDFDGIRYITSQSLRKALLNDIHMSSEEA